MLLRAQVAPIIARLDKFSHILMNWDPYLAPWIARLSPVPTHSLMMVFGVIEIIAGLMVAFALRDLGLALGAAALGLLSRDFSAS